MRSFSDRSFDGLVARLSGRFGMTWDSDPGFVLLSWQIASANYPKSGRQPPAARVAPVIDLASIRKATSMFLDGGVGTLGGLTGTIWGLTPVELEAAMGFPASTS
jgi:hypothetical protein